MFVQDKNQTCCRTIYGKCAAKISQYKATYILIWSEINTEFLYETKQRRSVSVLSWNILRSLLRAVYMSLVNRASPGHEILSSVAKGIETNASFEGPEGGVLYSHFPAQIFTKSHRPTAQIPLSQCLPCSNLSPIPIFYEHIFNKLYIVNLQT